MVSGSFLFYQKKDYFYLFSAEKTGSKREKRKEGFYHEKLYPATDLPCFNGDSEGIPDEDHLRIKS